MSDDESVTAKMDKHIAKIREMVALTAEHKAFEAERLEDRLKLIELDLAEIRRHLGLSS